MATKIIGFFYCNIYSLTVYILKNKNYTQNFGAAINIFADASVDLYKSVCSGFTFQKILFLFFDSFVFWIVIVIHLSVIHVNEFIICVFLLHGTSTT